MFVMLITPHFLSWCQQSGKRATRAFLREHVQRVGQNVPSPNRLEVVNVPVTVSVRSTSNSPEAQARGFSPGSVESTGGPMLTTSSPRTSIASIESLDYGTPQLGEGRRKSGTIRLPPLSKSAGINQHRPELNHRESSSGESVTSTRKVKVDVSRSPMLKKSGKVQDIHTVV